MARPINVYTDEELEARALARQAEIDAKYDNRNERLDWIKARALEYLDRDADCRGALASFTSDCNKDWTGVEGKVVDFYTGMGTVLMMLGLKHAQEHDVPQMRYWIEGFN